MLKSVFILLVFGSRFIFAQDLKIDKIEPPNWWAGMKLNAVQLMVYGENLTDIKAEFEDEGLKVKKVHEINNPSYAFIDILISQDIEPGNYTLTLSNKNGTDKFNYEIIRRQNPSGRFQGFGQGDAIYLLMPDRFVNGDVSNDSVYGYIDEMQHLPAQQRKGGDLQGVINKLDYIKDLGFTTVWLNPVTENNTFRSYHGYASTNLYLVDPRLGTNRLYKNLVEAAHKRGLKIIMDHVANHISDDHPWMNNLPLVDWINGTVENHTPANHNKMIYTDPHADSSTIKEVYQGWFINYMPDLNQSNPFVANYLIQNTLWWMEYAGIDAIREDTYPYAEPGFMSRWAKILFDEYPSTNILGEVWTGEPAFLAAYQGDSKLPVSLNTNLPSLTDFALRDAFIEYLQEKKGLYNIYNVLAKDYLYSDPYQLVVFADNHDVGRVMFYANGNVQKAKLVFHMLMTLRGIPQVFYGTEIGMIENEDHGTLRKAFPGGFPGDEKNAFEESGRTEYENEIFNCLKQLLFLRQNYDVISQGKLTHFPVKDDVYIYFKNYGDQKVVNIINGSKNEKEIDLKTFGRFANGVKNLIDLKSHIIINGTKIISQPMTAGIYFLQN